MKICIFGAGAVGGYFGGRLAQAGNEVTFIARGAHLEALLTHGLQVKSMHGDFRVHPVKATDQPKNVGPMDVVLCCVKAWQVQEAAEQMKTMLGPQTLVIPLQNGVEAHAILSGVLGARHILPGLCKLITMVTAPGNIHHLGADPYLAFGESDGRDSARAQAVAKTFAQAAGMTVHLSHHIIAQLWRKFMLIAPWSGMGAVTRMPVGVFRSLPETRSMLVACIREVYTTARAHGVAIEEQAVEDTLAFIDQLPPEGTASMQRDILEGRPSELEAQNGAVVRYGEQADVPTPTHQFIYHSLLPLERQARGRLTVP